ncbi:hypothetical protein [Dyella humicola]|uniref:hypothetical protein n=1 Tax=Dyella humicola TaxID=2992126 RepID=UPI00225A3FA6|nr:hypothetical protein [Dyella humicola]
MNDPVCHCDLRIFPPTLNIPAGLSALPRQLGNFPEFRGALLASITAAAQDYPPLAKWRARDTEDFGLMLLEMWAYVCDIVAFYDQAHANESYLRTAVLPASLRRLVELIGYLPRPELAAFADIGALVEGRLPVVIPAGTAFRSAAFGTEPPQVFESSVDAMTNPAANQWGVVPPRAATLSGTVSYLLLDPATSRVQRDSLLWLELGGGASSTIWLGRAQQVSTVTLADGGRYVRVDLVSPLTLKQPRSIALTRLMIPTQKTGLWVSRLPLLFAVKTATKKGVGLSSAMASAAYALTSNSDDPSVEESWQDAASGEAGTTLLLNSLNRTIGVGDRIFLEVPGDHYEAVHVAKIDEPLVTVVPAQTITVGSNNVTTPATRIPTTRLFADAVIPDPTDPAAVNDSNWATPGELAIHFGLVDAGTVMSPADTALADSTTIELTGVHVAPTGPPKVTDVLLASADQRGVDSPCSVDFAAATLTLDPTTTWDPPLELPVQVYGNVLQVTRGETVVAEVLGNGDATQSFQTFTLQNRPLTYVPSATVQNDWGAISTLRIFVSGILWTEVPTLYGVGQADRVYIVRRQDDGSAKITFGSPLATGIGNIVAQYRFGAGAASPPAFGINQIARPVPGLKSIVNPVAAAGGADVEGTDSVRSSAPKTALLLGRAVSIEDFAAAAAAVGSVRLATAQWRWSALRQRAVVQVWYVGTAGLKSLVSQRLRGIADPATPIDVMQATPVPAALAIDVQTDPTYDTPTVLAAVRGALEATGQGLLEPETQGIGNTLFRSNLFDTVLSVSGAIAVRALTINGTPFEPYGRNPGAGQYFDFEGALNVTGSPSHG